MNSGSFRNLALTTTMLSVAAFAIPATAQDDDGVIGIDDATTETQQDSGDTITVTGSRLRRSEFTSISPIQTIDAQLGRNFGLTDATSLIAQSPAVTGAQFDGSINSGSPTAAVEGVPETGVGGSSIALRGLGPEATLVLVNGRRLSPSGVRGAPVAPDLNLIPNTMIERVEILTDGASSIYGADAVAGVANIILRNDFEGFEVSGNFTFPEEEGGEVTQFGFIGGAANADSSFTVALEYFDREPVIAGDRSDFNDCLRDIDVTASGNIVSACLDRRPDNAVFIGSQGFVYSTPGQTDIGVPGFSSGGSFAVPTSQQDIYNLQDEERATQLFSGFERINLYATGDYNADFFSRDRLYFEASYATRNSVEQFTAEQIFPGVPGMIPMEDANGNLLVNPDGSLQLFDNPLNPFDEDALPVITVNALQQKRAADVDNFRFVGGMEGDLTLGGLGEKNWVYDVSFSYDRSLGVASQPILNEVAIRESLDTLRLDADGNLICGLPRTALSFGFLTPRDCVVVDFFSPTLFTTEGGDKSFATQAERDFIAGDAINTTEIDQTVFSAIVTGDLFDVPSGTVGLVLGAEFRENSIDTVNDFVRANGLAASEIVDTERNTVGETDTFELFAETEIPITDTFVTNFSGRYTDEKFFGDEFTYSLKAAWDVTDWLKLRSTIGTTFRAPNLREQFLAGAAATIGGGNDPCLVPLTANNGGVYDPTGETRSQTVLDNCVAAGADPTALGLQATTGIGITIGGSQDITAETSDSFTAGFVFSQPWYDSFDFDLAVTYFKIDLENTVEEADAADILNRCYNDLPNLASPLCDRITRNTGNPATATIANIDAGFINVGESSSEGVDINARYQRPLDNIWPGADFGMNVSATYYIEQLEKISADAPTDDNVGEIGNPEFIMQALFNVSKDNWTLNWRTRYIDATGQDNSDALATPVPGDSRTACDILGITEQCRDVDFIDSGWYNDVSANWDNEDWSVTLGIANVFDEEPPLIDQGEGPSRLNIVTQSGYDLIGRRAFVNLTKRF